MTRKAQTPATALETPLRLTRVLRRLREARAKAKADLLANARFEATQAQGSSEDGRGQRKYTEPRRTHTKGNLSSVRRQKQSMTFSTRCRMISRSFRGAQSGPQQHQLVLS